MKRFKIGLVIPAALLFIGGTIWAASPHFVGPVKAKLVAGNDVQVCFKEAGLGSNETITYVASANATATFVCVNHGGQCPNAANKRTVSGPVSATGSFSSGKNGQISQCLTLEAPDQGSFSCPGGQTVTLSEVSYSAIQLSDTTNSVTQNATPSALSAEPFTCP
jgi:hypothetical protein